MTYGIGLQHDYMDAPYLNNIKRLDSSSKSFERFQQKLRKLFGIFVFGGDLLALGSQRDFWELLESSKWSRTKVHGGLYNVQFISQFAMNSRH